MSNVDFQGLNFYEVFMREAYDGGSSSQIILDNENLESNIKKFLTEFYQALIADCEKMIGYCISDNDKYFIAQYEEKKEVYLGIIDSICSKSTKDGIIEACRHKDSDWSASIYNATVMT